MTDIPFCEPHSGHWIGVGDRLPEDDQLVLAFCPDRPPQLRMCIMFHDGDGEFSDYQAEDMGTEGLCWYATHWFPIPFEPGPVWVDPVWPPIEVSA